MIPFPYSRLLMTRRRLASSPTDPNFANVSLLLHMNGTNGSTTFTDNSPSPRTMTANGNAQISTAQSVFGGASGLFDGAGDWVSTPSNAVFNMGSGDFSCQFWARFATTGSRQIICGQSDSGGTNASISFIIEKTATDKIRGISGSGSSLIGDITGATSVSSGTWYFIEYTRSGTNFYIFLNGTSDATPVVGAGALNSSSNNFSIGRGGEINSLYLNGHIDDFRLTKGVARNTSNYSVPSAQFPDS